MLILDNSLAEPHILSRAFYNLCYRNILVTGWPAKCFPKQLSHALDEIVLLPEQDPENVVSIISCYLDVDMSASVTEQYSEKCKQQQIYEYSKSGCY